MANEVKYSKIRYLFAFSILICHTTVPAQGNGNLKLWFKSPANALMADKLDTWNDDPEWLKALPVPSAAFRHWATFGLTSARKAS